MEVLLALETGSLVYATLHDLTSSRYVITRLPCLYPLYKIHLSCVKVFLQNLCDVRY